MTRQLRADVLLLGGLLVVAAVAAGATVLLSPPQPVGSLESQPSTFFTVGHGAKAAYLALDKLGVGAFRLRRPLSDDRLDRIDGLLILEPTLVLERFEWQALENWVCTGHRLVVAPGAGGLRTLAGSASPAAWFHVVPGTDAGPLREARAGRELAAHEPLWDGVTTLVADARLRFDRHGALAGPLADEHAEAIWTDDAGIVAIKVAHGAGEILAFADVRPLTNEGLREGDAPVFLANLAAWLAGGRVDGRLAFDEQHLGFTESEASLRFFAGLMLRERWGWGVLQLTLAIVLGAWAAGARLGRPHDLVVKPRRQQREFIEAAGRLLHDAGAAKLALGKVLRHHRARLAALVHVPATAGDAELSGALERAGRPQAAEALRQGAAALASERLSVGEARVAAFRVHSVVEAFSGGD